MKSSTSVLECPRSMVGRVIGKSGETVKALQTYTGATIQIDQTQDPTRVSITGAPYSLSLAVSMVTDIVRGSFKGFALLRQATRPPGGRAGYPPFVEPRPVYAPGYGLIPASQLYDDRVAPPMATPYGLRTTDALMQQQAIYPIMAGNVLTLQQDGGLVQGGHQATLSGSQINLSLPAGDLSGLGGGSMQHVMQAYPGGEAYTFNPMASADDFTAMAAGHRVIAAVGGSRVPRPKAQWMGQ